ncbi:MAG TPA: hypothetical protein VGJ60_34595, partial [Chloroflexota bacterium]
MPFPRWVLAARRMPRRHPGQPAPGGGRLFALGLVALGLGLLAIASAPLGIAGAQQQPAAPAPA